MAALTCDVGFGLIKQDTDFLQALILQHQLADLLFTIGQLGTQFIPHQIIQLLLFQVLRSIIDNVLAQFRIQPFHQISGIIIILLLQFGKHIQRLSLYVGNLLRLAKPLQHIVRIIDIHIYNHHKAHKECLHPEEGGNGRMLYEIKNNHRNQSGNKSQRSLIHQLRQCHQHQQEHQKHIADATQLVGQRAKHRGKYTVGSQLGKSQYIY